MGAGASVAARLIEEASVDSFDTLSISTTVSDVSEIPNAVPMGNTVLESMIGTSRQMTVSQSRAFNGLDLAISKAQTSRLPH